MIFIIVDLPEPLAPIMATNSPDDIHGNPANREYVDLAGVIGLMNVIQFDDRCQSSSFP